MNLGDCRHLNPNKTTDLNSEAIAAVLDETARRLGDNYPYFHPMYAGQMLKPPHPVARAAYALAMTINPNNHARDGGRASSAMEIEAVSGDCSDVRLEGVPGAPHFGRDNGQPGGAVGCRADRALASASLGSEQAHYTHQRISSVLKLEYCPVAADGRGTDAAGCAGGRTPQRAMWARWW